MRRAFRVHHDPALGESVQLVIDYLPEGMRPIGDGWWEANADVHEDSVYYYRVVDQDGRVTRIDHGRPRRPLGESVIIDRWRPADPARMARHSALFKSGMGRHWPEAQGASGLRLTLRLHEPSVLPGHRVAVVGSDPALGAWDVSRAERMTASPFPWWTLTIDLAKPDTGGEYSYLVIDDTGDVVYHEPARHPLPQCLTSTIVTDEAIQGMVSWRGTGVVVRVAGLHDEGMFGIEEFRHLVLLADWAAKCGISVIELPPVNDTIGDRGTSGSGSHLPVSIHALHPLHLDMSDLPGFERPDNEPGEQHWDTELGVDRPGGLAAKLETVRGLFDAAPPDVAEEEFRETNWWWLGPYAYWKVLRVRFGIPASAAWGPDLQFDPSRLEDFRTDAQHRDLEFWCWVQFHLHRQLRNAVEYVHGRGIALMTHLPAGVAPDSVETWTHPELFRPGSVLGLPPDDSHLRGQVLGSAVYDWEAMAADDHRWWEERFLSLGRYSDAYHIDHVLHHFRAWILPEDAVDGLLGVFQPCKLLTRAEVEDHLPNFDLDLFTRPLVDRNVLQRRFGGFADEVLDRCFTDGKIGLSFLPDLAGQRDILAMSRSGGLDGLGNRDTVTRHLLDLRADVTLLEIEGEYHPRVSWQATETYQRLTDPEKAMFDAMATEFYHHRNMGLWRAHGMRNLPAIVDLTPLLPIGHDSVELPGMVPDLLEEMGVLQLFDERSPGEAGSWRTDPSATPYLAAVTPAALGRPPLARSWETDRAMATRYWREVLGRSDEVPEQLPVEAWRSVVEAHLSSPAMLAIFQLEDMLASQGAKGQPGRTGFGRGEIGVDLGDLPMRDWRRIPGPGAS